MSKAPIRQIVSEEEYTQALAENNCEAQYESCGLLNLGGVFVRIVLKTNSYKLDKMWRCNFPQVHPDAYPVDGIVEVYQGEGDSVRLYDKTNHRMLITNNNYYGCVKYGYRVICADLMALKNRVTFHSSGIIVNDKLIMATGVSGAGKNTLFNYLDQKYGGLFLWDDWGVITINGGVYVPNDESYHMAYPSALSLVPNFTAEDTLVIEKLGIDRSKYMVPLHRLRKTVRNSCPTKLIQINTIVIITNEPDHTNLEKVNAEKAIEVFSRPTVSYAWECEVPFRNEHLLLTPEEHEVMRKQYKSLFSNVGNVGKVLIANNTRQEADKMTFLNKIDESI